MEGGCVCDNLGPGGQEGSREGGKNTRGVLNSLWSHLELKTSETVRRKEEK